MPLKPKLACGVVLLLAAVATLMVPGLPPPAPHQSKDPLQLGLGKLLVANPGLQDPNFNQTVVLLVHYDPDNVVGLVLNRRGEMTLARVFDELAAAKGRSDLAFAGGPVKEAQIFGLLRPLSPAGAPADADRVFADVVFLSTKTQLEKSVADKTDASRFRVYLGYAGWATRQLQGELTLGAWTIFPATAAEVFDPHPETLWVRLYRRTQGTIAESTARPAP